MDYSAASGVLTFSSSSRQQCVDITVVDDSVLEPLEKFLLKIDTTVDRVVLEPKLTTVAIEDNDSEGRDESRKGRKGIK